MNLGSLETSLREDDSRRPAEVHLDDEESGPRAARALELQRLLAEAIEKMPRSEHIVISLYYHEELYLREIAKIVNSTNRESLN